ncbi:MAG: 5-(carboxyamino)imidazole ribonucleotide synthase [Alloalcanivorax venustensis]|jgi:5-(carboxyamino)imidazole ribonucleotide synthase|uniref:5-(carboxyamino)imidazole ribonucleotide synthase n=1 Tax=Alloalcanivorax venustensis TaxID=172371 RepID=UPI00300293BA
MNRVLVLGGGQLGLMMAEAAARLGLVVDRYDPERALLLPGTSDLAVPITWEECLERYPVVTVEREAFPDSGLSARLAASDRCVARGALAVIPDRYTQKSMLDELGIATAPWRNLDRVEDLADAAAEFGGVVVKARSGGYDGRGTWIVGDGGDLSAVPAEELAGRAIVEKKIPFRRELSIVGARNPAGETLFYPLTRNWHVDGILRLSLAPANASAALQPEAESILRRIMEKLDYAGVMAVEFFEEDGRLLVNEIAPRVHNSGHWTHEGADWSQFDLHVHALAGVPLHSLNVHGPSAMVNLIGTPFDQAWLQHPGVVHWYGKSVRPGRKVGHANLVAPTLEGLRKGLSAWADVLPEGFEAILDSELALD